MILHGSRYHLVTLVLLSVLAGSALAVWPQPRAISRGTGTVRLSKRFCIVIDKEDERLFKAKISDLAQAIKRSQSRVQHDTHALLKLDRGASYLQSVREAAVLTTLSLSIKPEGRRRPITYETNLPYEKQDESYTLTVPARCSKGLCTGTLTAETTLGLLRGLTTFEQLVYSFPSNVKSKSKFIIDMPIKIEDKPAFPHRAFMLDTSRNFYSIGDIFRTLDTMSSVKLNVFHWSVRVVHATDSQSWPLSLPAFPELAKAGAYSHDQIYSTSDIKRVQKYANLRGISVLLEIDMPGHTASIADAYPQYVACANQDWTKYANEPPTGQLKLGDAETRKFASAVVKDASSLMKSPYFSIGGDEINEVCYQIDPTTSAALKQRSISSLLKTFFDSVHGVLEVAKKTPVVWEDIVLKHNVSAGGKKAIVMTWISATSVQALVQKGYRVVHASSDYLYLDCGGGAWVGGTTGNSWCDPFKSWQKMYSFDPYAKITSSQRRLIMGGETLLWSEQSDGSNLDPTTWPRAAAAAEVFWTNNASRRAIDALPRLHDWRYRAVQRGVAAIPIGPEYCALRPGACNL
ncbi:BZ3500_MvSof-1268-A1-R1_Chr1-3g01786 [Microbotryum saponariae]|uniref:Beta-hexosaminidase n=1 Tax=Microbotryum saponariae TaxID=289078 RepID=A0A2X0MFI3_9BASI|nr:BZ3500_MvSof-1268-A1-R1_Chr1-3g01786 [Microbotryum saponariae]SCZ94568.1 BZ3501_MvSof-1269-A2-R1_Chr1-3g01388 [Microbotryum saponariae]